MTLCRWGQSPLGHVAWTAALNVLLGTGPLREGSSGPGSEGSRTDCERVAGGGGGQDHFRGF